MNKIKIFIVVAISLIVVVAGINILTQKQNNQQEKVQTPVVTIQVSATPIVTVVVEKKPVVPLPAEEDIIRTFFNLINEGRISDSIAMMAPSAISDDSAKQAWGVQFNAFQSLSVIQIEPSMKEEWTESKHTYKLTLSVKMKPEAANAPIPNYGYDNGINIRWVTIEKISSSWKISSIATGP
jgi:hypothetical protein